MEWTGRAATPVAAGIACVRTRVVFALERPGVFARFPHAGFLSP